MPLFIYKGKEMTFDSSIYIYTGYHKKVAPFFYSLFLYIIHAYDRFYK